MRVVIVSCFLFYFALNYSCNDSVHTKNISEGEIDFNIEYLDDERIKPFIVLLPSKVTTYFKENSSCTLIDGELGIFKLTYILNAQHQRNYSVLQILDKKYAYESDLSKMAFGYEDSNNFKIVYTDKKKKIAGYKCNHAMAIYNVSKDTINLYYTKEIIINHPNLNNPYKEIDGVLMEFSLALSGINMNFTASKVRPSSVDSNLFNLPEGCEKVSEEQMNQIFNNYYYSSDK